LTNRPLTAHEQADARAAYNAIGRLYSAVGHTATLGLACAFLGSLIDSNTTDGKPLRTERAPTKDDAGKRVKVRSSADSHWCDGGVFIGFDRKGRFVVQSDICDKISLWRFCIIDDAAQ
jgi:hypothetical protein